MVTIINIDNEKTKEGWPQEESKCTSLNIEKKTEVFMKRMLKHG